MRIILLLKKNKNKWGKNAKNLFGVFAQVKIGLKKKLPPKESLFIKGTCGRTLPATSFCKYKFNKEKLLGPMNLKTNSFQLDEREPDSTGQNVASDKCT